MDQTLSPALQAICEETLRILRGDYLVHPLTPGCEGVEDAFAAEDSPCSQSYGRLYAAKQVILDWGQRHFEAPLEEVCREYEFLCNYFARAMFAYGVRAGQRAQDGE